MFEIGPAGELRALADLGLPEHLLQALAAVGPLMTEAAEGMRAALADVPFADPVPALLANAGQALPALKSRQVELGLKHAGDSLDWRIVAIVEARRWGDSPARCNASTAYSNIET